MRRLVVIFILLSLGLLVACGGESDGMPPTAVTENGVVIAPEFQAFYQAYGGEAVLGAPITEMFSVGSQERPLQYFQNIRLEYDTEGGVSVSPLGAWELGGLNEQVLATVSADGAIQTFPNSEFTVQDEFLRFYDEYAGDVLLGLPISPQLNVDGLRVQYFENGRLEWHPEATAAQRVQLSDLGQTHFDNEMVFAYQEMHPARPVSSAGVTEVDVSAYLKAPILYDGEEQVLYVTVKTMGGDPVSNVTVEVAVSYDDKTETVRSMPTNDLGQVMLPLNFAIPAGTDVVVRLTALGSNGNALGETVLTYKTWW